MKKNKFRLNSLIILVLSIGLIWFIMKDTFQESISILLSAKIIWLILAFIVFIAYFLLETLVMKKLINVHKPDYTFKSALKLYMMTRFFNGITPFSSGGQPLQVYELKKEGVRITDGTTIIIKHFIIFQTSMMILGTSAIILNTIFDVIQCEAFLRTLLITGFAINFGLLIFVYFVSTSKKLTKKTIIFIINLLSKLKIVKHKEETSEKWTTACSEYYESFRSLMLDRKFFWTNILIEVTALIIVFTLPIFVFEALGYTYQLNVFICILTSIYVFIVGSYVPIPGGTGGIEFAFCGFFSKYIPSSYLSPAVILWRLIDYYMPVIIGGLFFNYKKAKRDKIELNKSVN